MSSAAPSSDATAAFARAAKRIRTMGQAPFELKDLTTALSNIEGHAQDNLYFEFKVPANRDVELLDPVTMQSDVSAHKILIQSVDELLSWRWEEAKELAKKVLLQTQREDFRDEALNVMAAASAMSGDLDSAIAALKQAVEGQWNFALQQNLGILALKHDPQLAAQQSTFWLDAAETVSDRERAVFLVLSMWSSIENNEGFVLPPRIRDSFRDALKQELGAGTMVLLGLFLARNDSDWVADSSNWSESPHSATEIAQMITARAQGFDNFVDFLIQHSMSQDLEVLQAVDNFVSDLLAAMFGEEGALWAAWKAMNMIEHGLPCDSINKALLRAMTVREICIYLRDQEGEPKDELVDWLLEARNFLGTVNDEEIREVITDTLASASTLFFVSYLQAREVEVEAFAQTLLTVHDMTQKWSSRLRLDKDQARRMALETRRWGQLSEDMISKLKTLPFSDERVTQLLDEFIEKAAMIRRVSNDILGNI